jgi:hypothetical protein
MHDDTDCRLAEAGASRRTKSPKANAVLNQLPLSCNQHYLAFVMSNKQHRKTMRALTSAAGLLPSALPMRQAYKKQHYIYCSDLRFLMSHDLSMFFHAFILRFNKSLDKCV